MLRNLFPQKEKPFHAMLEGLFINETTMIYVLCYGGHLAQTERNRVVLR
jgi:hypothetical protein